MFPLRKKLFGQYDLEGEGEELGHLRITFSTSWFFKLKIIKIFWSTCFILGEYISIGKKVT